ncbi:triosephosphate isomerase [Colletotrichum tabaci]|uniref:Triosephosphate isomerase n=1 Tax=Colletotrichum tabaci TaxID=1209068 RepID=A0AAV9T3V9_9PEZI
MATSPSRRLIGLSTKMYFPLQRTLDFVAAVQTELKALPPHALDNVDLFIIPDFVSIHPVNEALKSSPVPIRLGAQDCHWDDFGAFTGEVSPAVLSETGVTIVEVGHAERRRLFGETDEVVAKKAAAASRNGMTPLICIGEKTKGDLDVALSECKAQIDQSLTDVPDSAEVIVAYEPVWAIGASQPASEDHVIQVVKGIRAFESIKRRTGTTRVIYGGSAGPGLFERLGEAVDGLFLGRFGHDVPRFLKTVSEVAAFQKA